MSSNDGGSGDSGPGTREVAHRIFAAEFDDADFDYSESDEERAPNYVVTPTGLRVNRVFTVGVLTEVESVNEQTLRGRVVDPSGAFVTYAGQYQPDEMAFLDRTTPPAFVALTGKARTFQPEDSDLVYTSVRPESFAVVDAETRDRWTVSAAEATLDRVAVFVEALSMDERGDRLRARLEAADVPTALATGIPLAIDHYDTGTRYLEAVRTLAVDALEVVADDRDEVRDLTAAPGDRGGADLGPLPEVPYDIAGATVPEDEAVVDDEPADSEPEPEPDAVAADTDAAASTESSVDDDATGAAEPAEAAGEDSDPAGVAEADPDAEAEPEPVESAGASEEEVSDTATVDTDDDLPEFDDAESTSASADTDAAASTDSVTDLDGPDADTSGTAEAADTGAADTATEPAEAAEADDASAEVAETDPGASAEPEPIESTGDDLGDFDDGGLGEFDAGEEPAVDLDADPEDLDEALTEEERREVEAEHGVEFSTGSEVPDPGEAGIETPDPESTPGDDAAADPADGGDTAAADDADGAAAAEADAEADADDDEEGGTDDAAAPDDLEDAVVDLMAELDDGDGAAKAAVVDEAVSRYGVAADAAEDAIDGALMSGQCFEPTDGTLKAI